MGDDAPDGGGGGWQGGWSGGYPRRRGKGRGKGRGRQGDRPDVANGEEEWVKGESPSPGVLEGEWTDSLGHTVQVDGNGRRRGPLTARLVRGSREQVLSLRCDPSTGAWACGNALLDLTSSGPKCLVWAAHDGRRSVWRRRAAGGDGQEDDPASSPDLLPWLLVAQQDGPGVGVGAVGVLRDGGPRQRWASIAEEDTGEEDAGDAQDEARREERAQSGEGGAPDQADGAEVSERSADAARIIAVLDVRQVLGNDWGAQEALSYLLMDHDLLRGEGEDPVIPSAESPLWERLPSGPRRNALHRFGNFQAASAAGCVAAAASPDFAEVRCGRHRVPVASTDVQALLRRWTGPEELPERSASMAHVLSLYRMLESPQTPCWQRGPMQLAWDPLKRKRSGVEYELFASPFNARVANGRYASRFPHAEANFGSIGAYPFVVDQIPTSAVVGINPPFSTAYLDHVMGKSLDGLVRRFKGVHLTVPVREASWRPQLQRLKGASFVQQFWDATALMDKPLAQPVLYWEGSDLAPPAT